MSEIILMDHCTTYSYFYLLTQTSLAKQTHSTHTDAQMVLGICLDGLRTLLVVKKLD